MPKYTALTAHLAARNLPEIAMTFAEIEALLGFPLPPSSRKHRAFWSNNPTNSVMTKAWLQAGYQSKAVDVVHGKLLFAKMNAVEAQPAIWKRHPLIGRFEGMITVAPGVDLTDPADPAWGSVYE